MEIMDVINAQVVLAVKNVINRKLIKDKFIKILLEILFSSNIFLYNR